MAKRVEPKHFYLNEQHELSRLEREGGGRLPKLGAIDWGAKELHLTRSLSQTRKTIEQSSDPLRGQRYFLLARAEETVPKLTSDKRKAASGHFDDPVDYAGKDSRVLGKLGLDVISVTDRGAIVHATPERFERLESMAPKLGELGKAEQARWAFVADFTTVPPELRADEDWLASVRRGTHETIVELQPLLSRAEGALVLNAIADNLRRSDGEAILASGTDYSGRAWVRTTLVARTIGKIVKDFFSVQALHGPLLSETLAIRGRAATPATDRTPVSPPVAEMPVVAVVDSGVARNHARLESYRRGMFIHPQSQDGFDDHGTFVTSRVVFGDPRDPLNAPPFPEIRFVDVIVARDRRSVDDKIVVNAIETVAANYPDARTFNLSFGDYVAINLHGPVEKTERLFLTQDLDNLIFAKDLLIIVAAGNSEFGLTPNPPYADHWQDPVWGLGNWAVGFNTLKCGSFVREWTLEGGVADVPYAPSPFCKAGPALANGPAPDFSAHGGNSTPQYRPGPLGVWGLNPAGLWEYRSGTSYAAPILSRECAFALALLQRVCPAGSSPFGATVKAFLALTADPVGLTLPTRFREAAARTLGFGVATSRKLESPDAHVAIFVWQGVLNNKSDIARVVVPIPTAWLEEAEEPLCDIAVSWDSPVNAAVPNIYGCRRVDLKLKPVPDADAVRGSRGSHGWYPLRRRTYGLKKAFEDGAVGDDLWTVELSYEEICDYPPTQTFTPEQRVSFALRLRDRASKTGPQAAVQALEMVSTMTHLSAGQVPVQVPVMVKRFV